MKYLCLLLLCFCFQSVDSSHWFKAENRDCTISRLIIKQIIDSKPVKQFSLVCDVTGCHIAQQIGIRINRVALIPYDQSFFGKKKDGFPATIHMQVPGVSVSTLRKFNDFSLFQHVRPIGSWMYEKWGPLPVEIAGVSVKIIRDMSLHDDLPPIVALDTFVGNPDRSNPNLFYDSVSDRFYGIDLGESFKFNLAKEACRYFEWLSGKMHRFSSKEEHALKLFLKTIKQLVQQFDEQAILTLFTEYACKVGFVEGTFLYTTKVRNRIELHSRIIKESVRDSKELIKILSGILNMRE